MMKSPSKMSALIRAKKHRMQEDPDVIDSGDSPSMDLQDEEIARLQEANDAHNMNHPMDRADAYDQDPEAERREEQHEQDKPHMKAPLSDETRMMAAGGYVDPEDERDMRVDGESSDEHERDSMREGYAANDMGDPPGLDYHEEESLREAREDAGEEEQLMAEGGLMDPADRSNPSHDGESSDEQAEDSQEEYDMLAKGGMPKLGSGARFAAVERHAAASGARDPAAVAAAAGRAKYGNKRMAHMAAAGRKAEGGMMAVPAFHGVAEAAPETHEEAAKRRKIRIARMLSK